MSLVKQIAKNTLYLAVGKTASTALAVIAIALYLRYLSPDDYGRYTTIIAFVLLFGTFVDFGLNITTTQDISQPKADVEKTLSSVFTFRILVNIGLLALLPVILFAFPYEPIVKQGIMVASGLFFFMSIFQVLASYYQKILNASAVALAEFIGRIALLVLSLIAIYLHASFLVIISISAISAFVQTMALFLHIRTKIKLKLSLDKTIIKRIMHKTWPIALSVIFTTIYFKGDTIVLSIMRPYVDVGIYGAAYKVLEVLIALPILMMGLVLPQLSKSYAEHDHARFNLFMQKTWDAMSLIILPMVFGTLVIAPGIISLIAGNGYSAAGGVLRLLIIATACIFLGSLFTHAVVAINKQKIMIKYYALTAIVSLGAYVLFIPTYSYTAAAIITIAAEACIALAAYSEVRKVSRLTISLSIFGKGLFASLCMAGMLLIVPPMPVLLSIAFAGILYGLLIILFRAVPKELYPRSV